MFTCLEINAKYIFADFCQNFADSQIRRITIVKNMHKMADQIRLMQARFRFRIKAIDYKIKVLKNYWDNFLG
jgi:hypothetical protein